MKLNRTVLAIGTGFAVVVAVALFVIFVMSSGNMLDIAQ